MGKLIGQTADPERIEAHVRTSYRRALAMDGAVAKAGQDRLAGAIADIDAALEANRTAAAAAAGAADALAIAETKANDGIGRVRDDMWNVLGRPRQNAFLDRIFPQGVGTYTKADAKLKALFMQVLVARIQAATSGLFTQEQKDGWVAELEAKRKAYQDTVAAHAPLEAAATLARFGYRGAVRTALARLRDFKRDLQTLGLDEASIHDIIPDAARPDATPPVTPVQPVAKAA
jgi:hypothetical protein